MLLAVEVFPQTEVGLYPNLLKKFRFQVINKGEYIFKMGETAEQMYFIMEGKVDIVDEDGTILK